MLEHMRCTAGSIRTALSFCWSFALILSSAAQTPDTAALRGIVLGPTGAPIRGARIHVAAPSRHLDRTVTTGADGVFVLSGLPADESLAISAAREGFTSRPTTVFLQGDVTASVVLRLSVSGGETDVHVTGAVGDVRADEPALGDRLSASQMRETPLLNRRITFLPLLNAANRPAINQGDIFMNQDLFTSNGTGRRQTWFEVDGANAVDMWGRQTIFTNIPLDALGEMTVFENAFTADTGFGEGAVVNIITRSGSGSAYHGDVLALGRPSGLESELSGFSTSTATSGNDIANDTLLQGSASLSGPVSRRSGTTFAATAEYSAQDRASPVISPLAPGNFVGHYRDWLGFVRLDHRFSEANTGFFRGSSDAFVDTNPNGIVGGNTLPTVARTFHRRTFTAEAGDTSVLTPSLVNDVRLQFQLASPITQFVPVHDATEFSVPISSGGTFTSGTSQSALLENRQYAANDTVAKSWSRNQLRFGVDVIHAHNGGNSKEFGGPIYDGEFIYKACTGTAAYCESAAYLDNLANVQSYTQSYGDADYTVDDTLAAGFVQDDAHLTENLTLNLGLRYEVQTFTDSRKDVAPRVGFAYNVAGRGRTTVRGGLGIYYSQVVDNEEADYALTGPTGVFNYTAAPGQAGFPSSIAAAPLPAFPASAVAPLRSLYLRPGRASYYNQFLPTSELLGYPGALLNPYNEQWTLGFEQQVASGWVLSADYLGSHTLKIVRPLDLDAPTSFVRNAPGQVRAAQAANCTRPYWVDWYAQHGLTCDAVANSGPTPPYSVVQVDVNDGVAYYESVNVNLSHHSARGSALLASYVYSHALDTVDPDVPSQNPNDPRMTGEAELGNAIFDQRHRFVLSGVWVAPWGFATGGVATLASGLPYNVVTGSTNSGDTGATTDRPVVDGVVLGRDTGRGAPIYDVQPFVSKRISLGSERVQANLRAEAFNVLNHRNVVGYSGTWGNGAAPGAGFGEPLAGITNQLPAREFQFSVSVEF